MVELSYFFRVLLFEMMMISKELEINFCFVKFVHLLTSFNVSQRTAFHVQIHLFRIFSLFL